MRLRPLALAAALLAACVPTTIETDRGRADRPPRDTDVDDTDADTDDTDADDTARDTAPDDTAPDDTGAPAGVCGDDALGASEECDGADDGACPGQCSAACQCPSLAPTGELAVHMIDVDQGDGLLVVSPDGFTLLVDAGEEGTYADLHRYLAAQGITGLDHTLVSHQHADHMGAMDRVLADHPEVGAAYDGGGRATSDAFDDYVAAAGGRRTTVAVGDTIDLGPSATVEVVHANIGDRDNENNNSVVIRVTFGEVTVLLGGDCEAEVCEAGFDPGPIDVYKVHHHGASDSTSARLLDLMSPTHALISAGWGNDYGHPHDVTLDALEERNVQVWRTDLSGNLVMRTDGAAIEVAGDL